MAMTPGSTTLGSEPTRDGPAGEPRRAGSRFGLAFSVAVLAIFAVMWIGFAYALIADPGLLDQAWDWFLDLPTPVAVVVWVLVLPIPVGLWIWHSSWPPLVGALLALGMVAWTLAAVSGFVRAVRGR